ncbi:hypothetical protein [Pedobacter sp. NJ-S-72]
MLNKSDDGFEKDNENGLILTSSKVSTKLITLFKSADDVNPFFFIEKDEQEIAGLRFSPADDLSNNPKEKTSFFFHANGSLGIGKRSNKDYGLDVNGFAAMEGRVGTFVQGKIAANGKWHTIIDGLDNCQAFEIIARTGRKRSGKFAILHAYALSALVVHTVKSEKHPLIMGFSGIKSVFAGKAKIHTTMRSSYGQIATTVLPYLLITKSPGYGMMRVF